MEYLTGLAANSSTSYWVMSGWVYDFTNEILNSINPPLVNTMASIKPEEEVSLDYKQKTDVELQKLGVMGITMLTQSGDEGTYPNPPQCTKMSPNYPCTSIYITTVGGTSIIPSDNDAPLGDDAPRVCKERSYNCNCTTATEEQAMSAVNSNFIVATGGGFSDYAEQPDYQQAAVQAYLDSDVKKPSSDTYNSANRAFPDVSAVGSWAFYINFYNSYKTAGTDVSTAVWGGIVTLLNNEQLNNDKNALGFINPLLYQMQQEQPDAFNDITVGENYIDGCRDLGFVCTTGWDPLTGLGTPNFDVISDYVKKL